MSVAPREDGMSIWTSLAQGLPKLKTRLQLTGLVILVGGFLVARSVAPEEVHAQICVGVIGVLFLVFGQVFNAIRDIPELERARLLFRLFLVFAVLVVALIVATGYFLVQGSTMRATREKTQLEEHNKQAITKAKADEADRMSSALLQIAGMIQSKSGLTYDLHAYSRAHPSDDTSIDVIVTSITETLHQVRELSANVSNALRLYAEQDFAGLAALEALLGRNASVLLALSTAEKLKAARSGHTLQAKIAELEEILEGLGKTGQSLGEFAAKLRGRAVSAGDQAGGGSCGAGGDACGSK
jgi:hypothetical protein